MDVEAVDSVEVIDVVEVVDVEPVEVVEASGSNRGGAPESASKPVRPVKKPVSKSNPFDSFRILGVGLILALVLVIGFFLVNYFLRGSAEDWLARADTDYEKRSYESAANAYREFPEKFPTHEKVSYTKIRNALARLRDESEGAPDPVKGLEVALEVLPPVASEPGMPEQQSDLAGALVALAQKFIDRADSRTETAERKSLMAEMDKLMELINNPQYVGSNQRNQQAPSLARIEEDRSRILREINRDEELVVALAEIDKRLEAKDTLGAYDVRRDLIGRYPLLEANELLIERTTRATQIQQSLVSDGTLNLNISKEDPSAEVGRSFILANRTGKAIPALAGRLVFVKVKGSVYGFDASTGDIVWRKYVGRGFETDPIRLGDAAQADALLAQPEIGKLSRIVGASGEAKWVASMGEPMLTPTVESEDMFVATYSGKVASLDGGSGQAKWSKQLPQPIEVAPGAAFGKPNLYLPGEHSNLYVLDRRSGECKEVFYLGHDQGSIAVPPVLLLGQLFVFENINSQSARIRVLSTNTDGLQLQTSQSAFPIEGNIVVPPQIDRRRLIVQSDLGQIVVLDIEPTAETQKVSQIATVPKNLYKPQISWAVAGENKLWMADTRFTRFDMQVTVQKLERAWIKNDGDTFTGPLQLIDGNVIIHSRTQRGNLGVRVAAVDAQSGEPFWQTDVGVPVTMIAKSGNKYDAVNSGGALYTLDNKPIRSTPDADPTQGKPAMQFANPTWLDETSAILFNRSKANQMAIYKDQSLRVLSANLGSAVPSCPPTPVGDKIVVGLDNGQLVMINPSNGSLVGAPYQPAMEPGKSVRWNQPYLMGETLIVASDLQKLVRLTTGDALSVLTEADLESPLVGPLGQLGNQVCGVQSSAGGDALVVFNATSLAKENSVALDGRLVAGPFPTDSGVVLQTNTKLIAISSDASMTWSIDFPNSQIVAAPADANGNWVLVNRVGQVWVIEPTSGRVVGSSDVGQALSAPPLVLPAGLLVGSDEGAVLAVPVPTAPMEGP
ncbi:MAG: PQQ-binding-like beta-propeller repeat protein [Pirellulaceae bacterium]